MWLEDDDIFGGKPEDKFFDIVYNANKNLVQNELINVTTKSAAMELLLEEMLGEEKDIEGIIANYIMNNQDKVNNRINDLYIEMTGNILSQNE